MIVCGIDASLTNTGIAVLLDGSPILLKRIGHGTINGKSYAHRSDRIVSQCRAVIEAIDLVLPHDKPDLAVIEGPAYGNNNASTHDGSGLWWGLYSTLRARRIPLAVVAPKTRALFATGNGNASKLDVLAAMGAWYPGLRIDNHDQADALALASMGAHWLGDFTRELKPRQCDAVATVRWPMEARVRA